MLAARFGHSEANTAICHRMAAFLPTLSSLSSWSGTPRYFLPSACPIVSSHFYMVLCVCHVLCNVTAQTHAEHLL